MSTRKIRPFLCILAMFCVCTAAAVQVTEDATIQLTANSDTSYEIADGVTLTIDVTGMTNTLSGCITGTGTAKLRKTGLGELILSNGGNSVPGGIFIDKGSLCARAEGALGDGPITIAQGSTNKGELALDVQGATFNNSITVTGTSSSGYYSLSVWKDTTLNGDITASTSALYIQNYPVKGTTASKNFQTAIYNGNITLRSNKILTVRTYGTNVFNGVITAESCTFGNASSNDGQVYLNNPKNSFASYNTYRPVIHCGDTNVLRDAFVEVNNNNNRQAGSHGLNMHGHDQRVNYLRNTSTQSSTSAGTCPITSDKPCTLPLIGNYNGARDSGHVINGAVSLVLDAENANFVQGFTNAYVGVMTTHTTTGTVTVKRGTLRIRGDKTSFEGVPQVTVESNGALEIDTLGQFVFPAATNLTVDGTLSIAAASSLPFASGVTSLTLGETASMSINNASKPVFAGVRVNVEGTWTTLAADDYEYPDERVPQLKAGGFTVSGGGIVTATWTGEGGADTAVTNMDNWNADSLDFTTGLLVPTFATGGNTATVSSNVKFQSLALAAAEGETGFTFAKGADEGRVTFTGTSLDIADTDSTVRKYTFGVPLAVEGTQTLTVSLPASKTLAVDEGFIVPDGALLFEGSGSLQIGGSSEISGFLSIPSSINVFLNGTIAAPGNADQGLAQKDGARTISKVATSTSANGMVGLVVSNAVIRKPLCLSGGGSANGKYPLHVARGSTNVISGNMLFSPSAGYSNIRLYPNSELTCAGGVRTSTGPLFIEGDANSRIIFVEKPVTSRVEYVYSDTADYFGFAIRKGHATFDVPGNSLLHLRIGRSNEANSTKAEFLRSDMFSGTNTTLSAGLYSSGAPLLPITANNASSVAEFHSTTQRFARVIAGPKSTFNGDVGALLEIYGAQAPDTSGNIHVTEGNLYVAAAFTGGLSLKMGGTGTLLLTNAVSSTSGGIEVTNGTVRIAPNAAWTNATYIAVGGTGRLEVEAETGLGRLATFPKTTALSLSGDGVLSIPDGDELRFGSLTVDGAAFSCGRYTYETAPEPLKAHLAETTGSIMIGRTGTVFLLQ